MTRRSSTKLLREYELRHHAGPTVTKDGRHPLLERVKRDVPLPAQEREERTVRCPHGIQTVIRVSEGQIINPKRICKKLHA